MVDGETDLAHDLRERCGALVRGRRVVIVGGVLAAATRQVQALRGYGARDLLVVAQGVGTGPLPDPADATVLVLPAGPARTVSEEVRSMQDFAADPPASAREAVEAFDSDGSAVCLLGPFVTVDTYCGREALGGRTPASLAMEDKTTNDALWDAAGVTRAPARVVSADRDPLLAAAAELDLGDGTVWSGDASGGMNGGADLVRWVRTALDAEDAIAALSAQCERVRVMPFLEGVPCSIHGFVLPDGVAVFRPVELVILRTHRGSGGWSSVGPGARTGAGAAPGAGSVARPGGTPRFTYAGISTCWNPAPVDREEMRAVARRVGAYLAGTADYRGGFSVDGVITHSGFRPTELNPRFSGGLSTIARAASELPLELLQSATVRGIDVGATAAGLERLLVEVADRQPFGSAYCFTASLTPTQTEQLNVTGGPDGLRPAADGDRVVGTLELGPSNLGGLARFVPVHMTPGMRMAPYAVAALRLADELWGTGFGELSDALDVRG